MEKKELILTIAKDIFAASYPKTGGSPKTHFEDIIAFVKKEYEDLAQD